MGLTLSEIADHMEAAGHDLVGFIAEDRRKEAEAVCLERGITIKELVVAELFGVHPPDRRKS